MKNAQANLPIIAFSNLTPWK